ncbi:hypothetical protein YK48G_04400 [Lentilactobacillus fungorum]|uniref:Uncharacterized protein n=1 Tax=Lentilactobacillus fungorum TaxID=2201250 RepID=A0ABQ3VVV1_9LACO|nr:hypothetical protein [Lentilactobacillus fungorum]GHP13015.1 hypothetical protein YK48G_04400 [Lentilactobacillus fungorum]
MNAVVEWILHQISTQWIAILTAIAGFIAWKNDHAKLLVECDKIAKPTAGILLSDGGSIINQETSMQHLTMWLINPSTNDISYFDLRMLSDTDEINYYTSVQFSYLNNLAGKTAEALIPFKDGKPSDESIAIELPKTNYGTVPAHGFVQLDLVFHADTTYSDGMIVLKLAQSHNLWGRIRHSKWAPKWLRPKSGYLWSETQETSLLFQVTDIQKLEIPN